MDILAWEVEDSISKTTSHFWPEKADCHPEGLNQVVLPLRPKPGLSVVGLEALSSLNPGSILPSNGIEEKLWGFSFLVL